MEEHFLLPELCLRSTACKQKQEVNRQSSVPFQQEKMFIKDVMTLAPHHKQPLTMNWNPLKNTQAKNTCALKIRQEFTVNTKQHFPHKPHRFSGWKKHCPQRNVSFPSNHSWNNISDSGFKIIFPNFYGYQNHLLSVICKRQN